LAVLEALRLLVLALLGLFQQLVVVLAHLTMLMVVLAVLVQVVKQIFRVKEVVQAPPLVLVVHRLWAVAVARTSPLLRAQMLAVIMVVAVAVEDPLRAVLALVE
jgi:hypothetical protein